MNSLIINRKHTEADLSAAIDGSVEAAIDLGMSDADLLALILKTLHAETRSNVVQLHVAPQRKMYNSDAGP